MFANNFSSIARAKSLEELAVKVENIIIIINIITVFGTWFHLNNFKLNGREIILCQETGFLGIEMGAQLSGGHTSMICPPSCVDIVIVWEQSREVWVSMQR